MKLVIMIDDEENQLFLLLANRPKQTNKAESIASNLLKYESLKELEGRK